MKSSNTQQRRKFLLASAGVSGLAAWQTPLIKSVVLPAHAQMSFSMSYSGASLSGNLVADASPNTPFSWLIKEAHAGAIVPPPGDPAPSGWYALATNNNDGTYTITLTNPDQDTLRVGTLNVDGTPAVLVRDGAQSCYETGRDLNAYIHNIDETVLTLRFDRRNGDFIEILIPEGSAALPEICTDNG